MKELQILQHIVRGFNYTYIFVKHLYCYNLTESLGYVLNLTISSLLAMEI